MDPLNPSAPELTDFLLSLWDSGLSPETVRGYRAALNSVFKHTGCKVFEFHEVNALMRNFYLEKPVKRKEVPQWNLPLVLAFLKGAPFEPLEQASILDLTRKVVFLIALASGRRRSEIHAFSGLDGAVRFTRSRSKVTLVQLPSFVAKNQSPKFDSPLVEIPALLPREGDPSDANVLCPVRALAIYLDRVTGFRGTRRRLFIPTCPSAAGEIKSDRITAWIRSVISESHAASEDVSLPDERISAHEVRALATSWRMFSQSCSVSEIMQAAFWRSPRTFAEYYLRDLCGQTFDLYSLGPIVAGQAVVHPPE